MFALRCIQALSLLAVGAHSLTPAQWRSQSIYQVMTDRFARTDGSTTAACNLANYCGGTWQGLIDKLDYIQGMGFTAVWVSPVVENLPQNTDDGQSYHGYWAQNIYQTNPNFGSAQNLVALSKALHSRGMYLMVDVVTNHMGYAGCETCVDYSVFHPFNQRSQYHAPCIIDYNNITSVRLCWEGDETVSLPDLRTEDSGVLKQWEVWIAQLISNYTIDGLRIDSAAQVNLGFWQPFMAATGGMYAVGEVLNGNPTEMCIYQTHLGGLMNYANYFWIIQAFQSPSGDIGLLANGISWVKSECTDVTLLGSFTENHDNPRFASYTSDYSLAKNAIGFAMLADGIPIIYQGQEQHLSGGAVPSNREAIWLTGYSTTARLYIYIKQLNAIRKWAISRDSSYTTNNAQVVYSDQHSIVMRKGATGKQVVSFYTNRGASGSGSMTLASSATAFSKSQCVIDLLTCKTYKTDSSGKLAFSIQYGLPMIFYPMASLSGSGLCPSSTSCASDNAGSATESESPGFTVSASIPVTAGTTTTLSPPPSTSAKPTSSLAGCSLATIIPVTFNVLVNTTLGENIFVVGSIPQLGDWSTSDAIALSADSYTTANPLWTGMVTLPVGAAFNYKYIRVNADGSVTWEADPDRDYTVLCATEMTVAPGVWQTS